MNSTEEKAFIAKTILEQLGGSHFTMMTAAKNFLAMESGLAFAIPGKGFAKDGINELHVILDASDTYTVRAFRVRRSKGIPNATLISEHSGVYNDNLQSVFTGLTGLDTHF